MVYQETPARRHCSDRSKPKSHRTGQIRHDSTPALGINHVISGSFDDSKEALVQGWLNNIQALGSGLDARGPPSHKPSNSNRLSRPRSLSPARGAPNALPRSRWPGIAESVSQSSRERRHRRLRASFDGPNFPDNRDDSSVIAPRPLADNSRARRSKLKSAADASGHERSNKRPRSGPAPQESGSPPSPSPPEYNFEKRARHRTKSDRYDTVKQDDIDEDNRSKKSKTRSTAETRKTSRGNSHLASARDVMDNFNSQCILSGRITMPSYLRPGLFDNGRVSKKPVTDLMFHDMSFLKQPRREPPKPLSRRRESENKRGEREREDISAFFLHKTLADVQSRKQPVKNRHSDHDGIEDDGSSEPCERQHALSQPRPTPSNLDHLLARIFANPPHTERGEGKASARISWSASPPSTVLQDSPVSSAQELSSTPVRIRQALVQSGIFDNTGIACEDSHGYRRPEVRAPSREVFVSARSPTMSEVPGRIAQIGSGQAVLIVRYRDQGTMANEKMAGPEDHSNHLPTQTSCPVPYGERSDTAGPVQSMVTSSVEPTLVEVSTGPCEMTTLSTIPPDAQARDQVVSPDEGTLYLQAVPERPKSPKWAVIERLEAASEGWRSPCFPLPAKAAPQRRPKHPSPPCGTATYRSFSPNMDTPNPFSYVPVCNHSASGLVFEPVSTPFPRSNAPSRLIPSWDRSQLGATTERNYTAFAASQCTPGITNNADQISSAFPIDAKLNVMTAHATPILHNRSYEAQQSMKDYIAQIEEDFLFQTEEGEGGESTSSKEKTITLSSDLANFDPDLVQHESAHHQSHVGQTGQSLWQAPDRASPHAWAAVAELEEDEDQKFMASFWRPSGHHN